MSAADQGACSEVVRLDGHVVDSLLLPKVLDAIVDAGATYEILELEMGTTTLDQSHVRIRVSAADEAALDALLADVQVHGVNREDASDAELVAAPADGVLPAEFYPPRTWSLGAGGGPLGAERAAGDGLRPRRRPGGRPDGAARRPGGWSRCTGCGPATRWSSAGAASGSNADPRPTTATDSAS